jgi:hypothetical protein
MFRCLFVVDTGKLRIAAYLRRALRFVEGQPSRGCYYPAGHGHGFAIGLNKKAVPFLFVPKGFNTQEPAFRRGSFRAVIKY